ncbi:MAG: nucleotidyltransferase domain-containing protein [Verrucomicrobiota bacterium]
MNAPRFGLPPETVEKIRGVLALHPQIEKAVVYGSRAKGNYRNGSDIDLTLFGEGLDLNELLRIMNELDDLLLPYTIDLSIFATLTHPALLDHIRRVGVTLYQRIR